LLDQALDSSPGERAALVELTRSKDPALAADLERLLDANSAAAAFLAHPAAVYAAPLLAWAAASDPVEPGAILGHYEIVRRLGQGATATVYLARDGKHHREVAVKVLRPELAAAVGPDRFLREIDIAATLHHPHILPLFDSGAVGGLLYYVMPHVEGQSLRAALATGPPMPIGAAVRIAREVAMALDYSHRRGVIHRDIKPENILLQDGQAIVADFGIARAIEAADPVRRAEPTMGTGTPAYMSPEQLAPGAAIDGRSDIYALGCVLYEMLAGRPPYIGATRQAISAQQAAVSALVVRAARPDVPPSVAAAVARALAPAAADRFATAQELGSALADGSPAAPRQSRVRWLLVGGLMLFLLGLGVLTSIRRSNLAGPTSAALDSHLVAVLPFRVSSIDSALAYLQEGFVDLLAVQLTGEGGLRAADPRTVLGAWRQASIGQGAELVGQAILGVARQVGAGRVVDGAIAGSRQHVVVSASMLETATGAIVGRASVAGPLEGLGELGASDEGSYARQRGALLFGTARGDRSLLTGRLAYGTVGRGDGSARERFVVGGFRSPLLESMYDARRVDAPAYPLGSTEGLTFATYRIGIPFDPVEAFYAGATTDFFQTQLRSYGIELREGVPAIAALGTPEARAVLGFARAQDDPVRGKWRFYLSLALRP